jgi:tripartite-type tricarboxylate transporter receptor subunit TctC
MLPRRALLAALPLAATPAFAQERQVRAVVPFAPGGAIDAVARIFAQRMGPVLGESWVVENRSGANGRVGAEYVSRAAPDGLTLKFNADGHLVANEVMKNLSYDPIADFTPIARCAQGPLVLVGHPRLAAQDLPALVAAMKAKPQDFTFSNSGLGSTGHLATEFFKRRAGAPDAVVAAYRGTGPALNDVMAGSVSLMMAPLLAALPNIQGGKLRAYGLTSPSRSRVAPDIPTMAEGGMPEVAFTVWYGLWGPKGLAPALVQRLNNAARQVAGEEDVARRLAALGTEPVRETPEEVAAVIARDYARAVGIIREAGIEPE